MKRLRILVVMTILAAVAAGVLFQSACTGTGKNNQPYLVVLSLDGFRWDYPQMYNTPNLNRMAEEGVKAEALIPCFPTKTFPNHYSIATGLYPDHHGIVQNGFTDPNLGVYAISNRQSVMNPAFYGGEPIWVTAEKQGVKAATFYWVGSEAPVLGQYASIWKPYDHHFPFTARIDSVIAWLQLPEARRPRLVMWYLHEPDEIGHNDGPLAPSTGKMVTYLDSLVGVFRARLGELPIASRVNFIVLSDHGMGEIPEENNLYLDELVPRYWLSGASGGDIQLNLSAVEAYKDSLYNRLKKIPQLSVYKKEEVPPRLHYGTNPRILDLVVIADSLWNISITRQDRVSRGGHGYDNRNPDMHGIFYAVGPSFRQGTALPAFENVNLYPLFADLLKIKPAKTDGQMEVVKKGLK